MNLNVPNTTLLIETASAPKKANKTMTKRD